MSVFFHHAFTTTVSPYFYDFYIVDNWSNILNLETEVSLVLKPSNMDNEPDIFIFMNMSQLFLNITDRLFHYSSFTPHSLSLSFPLILTFQSCV